LAHYFLSATPLRLKYEAKDAFENAEKLQQSV
jgi:hypothetical protein